MFENDMKWLIINLKDIPQEKIPKITLFPLVLSFLNPNNLENYEEIYDLISDFYFTKKKHNIPHCLENKIVFLLLRESTHRIVTTHDSLSVGIPIKTTLSVVSLFLGTCFSVS